MDDSICHRLPPEQKRWFFPANRTMAQQARSVCFHCPVQVSCLDYALRNDEKHGVWGGASADDRASILEHRRRQSLPDGVQLPA